MDVEREHAFRLLSALAPGQVAAIIHVMEVMLDPKSQSAAHPAIENEEISDDEQRAVAHSKEWFQHSEGIPFEDVVSALGLTMDDIRGKERKDPAA